MCSGFDVFGLSHFLFYPVRSVGFPGKPPLPSYSEEPSYLAPEHCRLCLGPCAQPEDHHGPAHRRDVLERVAAEAPCAVSAQAIRARLTAYRDHYTHDNYVEGLSFPLQMPGRFRFF